MRLQVGGKRCSSGSSLKTRKTHKPFPVAFCAVLKVHYIISLPHVPTLIQVMQFARRKSLALEKINTPKADTLSGTFFFLSSSQSRPRPNTFLYVILPSVPPTHMAKKRPGTNASSNIECREDLELLLPTRMINYSVLVLGQSLQVNDSTFCICRGLRP